MSDLQPIIETKHLLLIQLNLEFLETSVANQDNATHLVNFAVPPYWFNEKELISIRASQIKEHQHLASWLLRAIVRRSDNQMIGHINAHGKPGMTHLKSYCEYGIEIGYTIYEPYKRRGYASEAILGFVDSIPKPVSVVLSIGIENNPSLQLARKLGYQRVGQVVEDGETEFVHLKRFV